MNVSKQIIEVINALCEKFGMAIDWSSANVLPYLEQLCAKFINFEICTSIFWMVLFTVVCGICWIVFGTTYKKAKEIEWDEDYSISWLNITMCVLGLIFTIVVIVTIGVQTFDIIEAVTFPEKTIYDYISYQISLMSQ